MKEGTPSEANHALGVVKTLFAWCTDRDMLGVDPCAKVKKPAKQGKRSRTLTEEELKKALARIAGGRISVRALGQLLILTAQRRGEVAQMQWPQLDFQTSALDDTRARRQE